GTMELGPANNKIYPNRVKGIVEAIPKYFPDLKVNYPQDIWYGYRPCSPDGLPYLGRPCRYGSVRSAGGGGMMALRLGPAFGNAVAAILAGATTDTDVSAFSPDRFQ